MSSENSGVVDVAQVPEGSAARTIGLLPAGSDSSQSMTVRILGTHLQLNCEMPRPRVVFGF
jgi:hypothetical protein